MNLEDNAYCEIGPDTLSRAFMAQLCVGADPKILAEEDEVLSSPCHSHVVALYLCTVLGCIAKFHMWASLYHGIFSVRVLTREYNLKGCFSMLIFKKLSKGNSIYGGL